MDAVGSAVGSAVGPALNVVVQQAPRAETFNIVDHNGNAIVDHNGNNIVWSN